MITFVYVRFRTAPPVQRFVDKFHTDKRHDRDIANGSNNIWVDGVYINDVDRVKNVFF